MASILLNEIFYPDITNIILDYIMISKKEAIKLKNFNMFYLYGKMTLASINPKHTYIDNVRKFHEFEKLNKKMYGMLKRDKKEKCVRTWL